MLMYDVFVTAMRTKQKSRGMKGNEKVEVPHVTNRLHVMYNVIVKSNHRQNIT
jgi:hypothetical protein